MARVRVGVSGWQYDGWRGDFYPDELPQRRRLEYATAALGAIEVNGTFYALKSPQAFASWRERAAPGTVFALKGSRYITHMLRLREPKTALANFLANGLLRLEDMLGPILWQLPPNMDWEPERFEQFCALLPKNTSDAAKLGRAHDRRVAGKVSLRVDHSRAMRHAFEIRDARMLQESSIRMLRRHGHALVFADTAGRHPYAEDITAGFIYVRLHGAKELYASGYDEQTLRWWKRRILRWHRGEQMKTGPRITELVPPRRETRDVYVFFDNDRKVHAPFDALALAGMLGQEHDIEDLHGVDGQPFSPPPRLAS